MERPFQGPEDPNTRGSPLPGGPEVLYFLLYDVVFTVVIARFGLPRPAQDALPAEDHALD
ncbi:hypothetical protein [Actinomadura craniellae]|uniref:hypothetical protein n=1 Tax=Actinomadura craniellae TaxID=2231787 RepID=UPI0011BED37F|nr:hypothetical protein [Actinomadura craniellae]